MRQLNPYIFKKCSRTYGFTLVEILITAMFFSAIFGLCLFILFSSKDSWDANRIKTELQQELRKASSWIKQDLQQSGSTAIADVENDNVWYDGITFNTASGVSSGNIVWSTDSINYNLDTNDNQIHRVLGADDKIVANNIESLQFRRTSGAPDIVEVQLQARISTLRGPIDKSASFEILLRN